MGATDREAGQAGWAKRHVPGNGRSAPEGRPRDGPGRPCAAFPVDRANAGTKAKGESVRNISRRLAQIEARFRAASATFSMTIVFVPPETGVTRTLLMESGKQVWTTHGHQLSNPLRSEEHTSELRSRQYLVCRLL